jgi:WD40 repeat protein
MMRHGAVRQVEDKRKCVSRKASLQSTISSPVISIRSQNMLSFFNKSNHSVTKLDGHTGAVISLALSPNGKLLASGGKSCNTNKTLVLIGCRKGADGIKVWDIKTYDELNIPQQPFHARAQVSCTAWITRRNEAFDTLCYGNALGWLVFLQH